MNELTFSPLSSSPYQYENEAEIILTQRNSDYLNDIFDADSCYLSAARTSNLPDLILDNLDQSHELEDKHSLCSNENSFDHTRNSVLNF